MTLYPLPYPSLNNVYTDITSMSNIDTYAFYNTCDVDINVFLAL